MWRLPLSIRRPFTIAAMECSCLRDERSICGTSSNGRTCERRLSKEQANSGVLLLVTTDFCHGRGRGFESRRPRHSFQRSCFNFGQTIEDAKRPCVAALSRPFCALFFCYMAAASCVVEPDDSEVSEEKTNDSTAACASCFAGLIAWV